MGQAVILAAGRGSRLLRLTQNTPKCMISLAGKTLFDWQTETLKEAGIKSIFVVAGYLADVINNKGYPSFLNPQWNETNMVESLCCAKEILSQRETIIAYGDIVYSIEIIKTLLNSFDDITVTFDLLWQELWEERFGDPLKDAETFRIQAGRVLEIGKKPERLDEVQGQFMGLIKLTPKGWAKIVEILDTIPITIRKKMDMTALLQRLIDAGIDVHGLSIKGKWCEVDFSEDLLCYEEKLQKEKEWTHDWRY